MSSDKRLACTLHWLAHGVSFNELGLLYGIGKSTAVAVVHDTVSVLKERLVKATIRFPEGRELQKTMDEFSLLARLPRCAGAIDGTFIRIDKPHKHGDCYYCYKKYVAILLLAVVNAKGIFTCVNVGPARLIR